MKKWIEENLTNAKGALNSRRTNREWFVANGFEDKYQQLISLHENLNKACRIVLGKTVPCGTCGKTTFLPKRYCSGTCAMSNPKTKEKKAKTCLEIYGVDHPSKTQSVRDKRDQTNIERYGAKSILQTDYGIEKLKKTNLERRGVEFPTQSKEVREKAKSTLMDRYGVDHNFKAKEVKESIKKTCTERYGTYHPMLSDEIKAKQKRTVWSRYGVENIAQLDEIKSKVKTTNRRKLGVDYPMQSETIKEKSRKTVFERYGVNNVFLSKDIREKARKTLMDRYGVTVPLRSEVLKNKLKQTSLCRYGVDHPVRAHFGTDLLTEINRGLVNVSGVYDPILDPVTLKTRYKLIREHRPDIKIQQTSVSLVERVLAAYIKENGLDVITSSRDLLNGQEIDIYIPSLKLGFEFNGTYWHSNLYKEKDYHQKKSILAKEKGITLVHLYEFDGIERNKEIILEHITGTYKPELVRIDGRLYHNLDRGSISTLSECVLTEPLYNNDGLVVYGAGYEIVEENHVL